MCGSHWGGLAIDNYAILHLFTILVIIDDKTSKFKPIQQDKINCRMFFSKGYKTNIVKWIFRPYLGFLLPWSTYFQSI